MKFPSALRRLRPLLAVLLLLFTAGTLLAEERWLLIFDTSKNMNKRLPAVDSEVTKLFVAIAGEHIHRGDSVGVWSFGTQLHAGELPLFTYVPENAAAITTNVLGYVHRQHYAGDTTFELLQPVLSSVVQHSERLTVIIFCDSDGQLIGTPYDYGINQSLLAAIPDRKKTKQPAVIILRTQRGKYVGGTVNFPPAPSEVPAFPPLPPPPQAIPTNSLAVAPEIKPAPTLPALIINGTAISTNPDVIPAYAPKPPSPASAPSPNIVSNVPTPAPPVAPAPPTPAVVPPTVAPAPVVARTTPAPTPAPAPEPTPLPPAANPAPAANTVSNAAAPAPPVTPAAGDNLDFSTKVLLVVGGIFFGMAVLLVVFFLTRRKAPQASLITSLMNDDPNRRK